MKKAGRTLLIVAILATLASLATWLITDRHYYTKFRVVEQVERRMDPDDLLAGTGQFDDDVVTETVRRDEFHLGLLPTPLGVFDKSALSVASLSGPPWALALGLLLWQRRRQRKPCESPRRRPGDGMNVNHKGVR